MNNNEKELQNPQMEESVEDTLQDSAQQEFTEEEKLEGHGGADSRICRQICDYLSGRVEEPIFDIYRGVTLSLAAIYAHLSVLNGKTYDISKIKCNFWWWCIKRYINEF